MVPKSEISLRMIQMRKENATIACTSWHIWLSMEKMKSHELKKFEDTCAASAPVASHKTQRTTITQRTRCQGESITCEREGRTEPGKLDDDHRRECSISKEIHNQSAGEKSESAAVAEILYSQHRQRHDCDHSSGDSQIKKVQFYIGE
jgi:hypothetical protein